MRNQHKKSPAKIDKETEPRLQISERLSILEDDKKHLLAIIKGTKYGIFALLPIVVALLFLQGIDIKNSLTQYKEFSDKLPNLVKEANDLAAKLKSLEKRTEAVEDRLLTELAKAEMLVGNKFGIFLGPFKNYDEATLFMISKELRDKDFWVIRSFQRKGEYLIVFKKSLSDKHSKSRQFLDELPDSILNVTEIREPLDWPIKLQKNEFKRTVSVDQKTKQLLPVINLPVFSNISAILSPTLNQINDMEHLTALLNNKGLDPNQCDAVTLRYYSLPENHMITKGIAENIKDFYDNQSVDQ